MEESEWCHFHSPCSEGAKSVKSMYISPVVDIEEIQLGLWEETWRDGERYHVHQKVLIRLFCR